MARAFGEVVVQDIHGEFKSGIQVDLIDPATGVRILDTVFADSTSAVTLSLPLVTNQYGRAPFYLGAGKLVIGRVTLAGVAYDDLIPVADPTATGGGGTGGAVPTHTHIEADVTSLPPDLAGKAPVAHAHVETDITNLPTDLAAKAPAAHVHAETEVTNLGTDLSATEKTANKNQPNGYPGTDNTNLLSAARLGTGTPSASTYLRGDRAWSTGTTGPLSGLTDAAITSAADGDVLVFLGSTSKWTNKQEQARTFEEFGGSQSASTIQTTAWSAARTWSDSVGGGTILFRAGTYPHMPQMELGNHMKIRGTGTRTTKLQFDASITGGACVYNHVSTNGTTDANAYACAVESMLLDLSLLPGWSNAGSASGIIWDQNPRFGARASPGDNAEVTDDAMHVVRDVFIYTPPLDGCVALAMGEQTWTNVRVYSAGRYGFQPPFDSAVINCCSGFSHQEGFFITGQPTKLIGCKAFASGNGGTGTNGSGFHIKSGPVTLVGCEAQDNYGAGIFIDTCNALPVGIIGGIMDSNSKGTSGAVAGIDVLTSTAVRIAGVLCQDRRVDGVNTRQVNACSLRTGSVASVGLTHTAIGGAVIGSPFKTIDTGCASTLLDVNNFASAQSVTYAASYTPDFFSFCGTQEIVLTGAITINAPGNGPYPQGAKITLILKQDGTGGRTITWNAIYVNTPASNTGANAYTIGRFVFDGTSWVGI